MKSKKWYGMILILALVLALSVYAKEKITSGEDVSGPKVASARQAAFGGGYRSSLCSSKRWALGCQHKYHHRCKGAGST